MKIANMRTYLLPRNAKGHLRILGERRTVCGRSIISNGENGWQVIHRGQYGVALPMHVDCGRCQRSPVYRGTDRVLRNP